MYYRKLISEIMLAIWLTISLLANFAEMAQAAGGPEDISTKQALLRAGLALPPQARFESPLLVNSPVLTISKIAPSQVTAGTTFTYTIIVANSTITEASNAIISDTLDTDKVTFAGAEDSSHAAGLVIWNPITIFGESTITRTLTVTVNADASAGEILSNTAEVTSTEGAGAIDTVSSTINTQADVIIEKSSDPASVVAGEFLTYTLTITNNGPSVARDVIVTDTLPAGVTVQSTGPITNNQSGPALGWDLGDMNVGATRTITLVAKVDGLKRGLLVNTASVTSTTADNDASNNSRNIETNLTAEVDLALTKTGVPATPILNGSLKYTLYVTNNGPSDATGVQIIDTLPSGMSFIGPINICASTNSTVTCNLGTIMSGESAQVILSVIPTEMGIFTNQAQVSASETDTNPENNNASEETVVHPANLSITKSGPTSEKVGYPLTYNLTIANHGPNDAINVIVTDTLPASVNFYTYAAGTSPCSHNSGIVTCTLGNLSNSVSRDITIVVTPTIAGTITNTAQVSSNNPDTVTSNNTATKTTTIDPVTDLSIRKTAYPNLVTAGESLTYTITITNNGPSAATGIMVTDTLPAGVTFAPSPGCTHQGGGIVTCPTASLLSGYTATFVINANVNPGTRGIITNTAIVTGNEFDPINNNSASVETIVEAETNLTIGKSANLAIAVPGKSLTYTLVITNSGPSHATGLVVTDTLPAGVSFVAGSAGCSDAGGGIVRCTLANLARHTSHPFTLRTNVAPGVTQPLQNIASVTGVENATAVSATLYTGILPQADLTIIKTGPAGGTLPGDTITYNLTVYNNGPSNATGIVVTDTLPSSVTLQSVTSASLCSGSSTIICNLGNLAANGTPLEVTIAVKVKDAVTGTISNQATVAGNEQDPSLGNNTSFPVSTAIGEFNKVYLPLIMKPAPTELYIDNDTGATVQEFTVIGTGVSCSVPAGEQFYRCGTTTFLPGTYNVRVSSVCTGYTPQTLTNVSFNAGVETKRVFCIN